MNARTLASAGASLAVIAGIMAANLWRELQAERELTATLRTQRHASDGTAPALPSAPAPAPAINAGDRPAIQGRTDARATTAAPPAAVVATRNAGIGERELLRDPEYRQARLVVLRSTIEQSYPGIAEELRLTAEETERLFGLLAETRVALAAETADAGQPVDAAAQAEMMRNRRTLQRQQSESLRGLLGDTRYAQWQGYQQTQSARLQASAHANALAQAGMPLDSAQTRSMATAMVTEQERMRQEILELGRTVIQTHPHTQMQAQELLRRRQQESSLRALDAVSPALNASQLRVLRRQIELQDAADRAAALVRERTAAAQPQD